MIIVTLRRKITPANESNNMCIECSQDDAKEKNLVKRHAEIMPIYNECP